MQLLVLPECIHTVLALEKQVHEKPRCQTLAQIIMHSWLPWAPYQRFKLYISTLPCLLYRHCRQTCGLALPRQVPLVKASRQS